MKMTNHVKFISPAPERDQKGLPVEQARHKVQSVTNGPHCGRRALGVDLLRSERWAADSHGSKIRNRRIPYILPSGHISGSTLLTWRCSSYQWIATVIRMVLSRIKRLNVVSRRSRYKTWHQLTQVAAYYVVTQDEKGFQRLLHCKKGGFVRLLYSQIRRVDDQNNRFLLDQTLSGVLWFQLRGNPRVKSTKKTIFAEYRKFLRGTFDSAKERRCEANRLCDPWIVQSVCDA